jgi:DNA-binding transcriptional LysR family regulator
MDNGEIDTAALRAFCVLMDERSVSRAALRLGLKQPTMSRLLAKLRAHFGDPLLFWSGGHMVPTPRANTLEPEIRNLLNTIKRITTPVRAFVPATSDTTFHIVATGYVESIFLSKVMNELAARTANIRLEIDLPDRLHDTGALERGEIDFLVGWNTMPTPNLRSRLLFTDKLVCIARATNPALIGTELTYEKYVELEHVQFDVPGRTTTELLLNKTFDRRGRRPQIRFRVQNFASVADVVAGSDLIATISEKSARMFLRRFPLKIFELPFRPPPMQIRVFWHERMHNDPQSQWFRTILAEIAKAI